MGKMPCLLPPHTLGDRGGGRGSAAAPIPAARGSGRLRGKGKRVRQACGADSRPQLGRGGPRAVWPRRRAAAGGGSFGPVSQRRGSEQGEGEKHHGASGVPKPTSIRAEG